MNKFYSLRRFFIALIAAVALTFGLKQYSGKPDPADGELTAIILKVIDGDTYSIRHLGAEEKLRLIGIDTPETQANRKAKKDMERYEHDIKTMNAMGNEARKYAQSLLREGSRVRLEFDVQKRDRYGRLLAYVYLENGEMLNEKIIAEGYATPMTYPPNVRYQQLFTVRYQDARYQKKGLWKTDREQ